VLNLFYKGQNHLFVLTFVML